MLDSPLYLHVIGMGRWCAGYIYMNSIYTVIYIYMNSVYMYISTQSKGFVLSVRGARMEVHNNRRRERVYMYESSSIKIQNNAQRSGAA